MEALARVPVSTLCDVDKSLPVVDPAIRPLTTARLCGPAYTVVAAGEFLSVLYAIGEAEPGDVLVVQAGGPPLAALGELLATEAWRRQLGGIVVDGYVRDRSGLPELPLWARGTVPMAGRSDVAPRVGGPVEFGGVRVSPGDVVVGDDDGLVIAPRAQLEACLERAAEIERCRGRRARGNPARRVVGRNDEPGRARGAAARGRGERAGDHAAELKTTIEPPALRMAPWPLPTFAAAEVRNPARAARRSAARTIPWSSVSSTRADDHHSLS